MKEMLFNGELDNDRCCTLLPVVKKRKGLDISDKVYSFYGQTLTEVFPLDSSTTILLNLVSRTYHITTVKFFGEGGVVFTNLTLILEWTLSYLSR
jgi:hypothetical protein